MSCKHFGLFLKDIRKKKGLTQKELASGICSKEYIYKIEKGTRLPSLFMLEQLSFKINVDLSYYLLQCKTPTSAKTRYIEDEINRLRRNREYSKIPKLISELETISSPSDTYLKQYILWNKGVIVYELNDNINMSLNLLLESLSCSMKIDLDAPLSCLEHLALTKYEYHIIVSIAKLLGHKGALDKACLLSTALAFNLRTHVTDYNKLFVYHTLLFNISVYLCELKEYICALEYCDELTLLAMKYEQQTLLAKALYQKSIALYHLGNIELSKTLAKRALAYFHFCELTDYVEIIRREMATRYNEDI